MSEVSLETKRYLDKIGSRVNAYNNSMTRAKEYVLENNVTDHYIVMNCIIMSLLWVAAVRGEQLTEEELFMFLNIDSEYADDINISIAKGMEEWGLEEVLDYVVANY
jgi:hypothetical protein